jgi:hypothetical protein
MTESEDFLTRWSRRKREAKADAANTADAANEAKRGTSAPDEIAERDPQARAAESGETKSENQFDLSKLPSLDSIGPATDIRAFLQPGVPEALSRAALRRAWSADPAIRDFVGLSENSWDFTAGDGMHGFGALDPEDAKRLVARLLGDSGEKTDAASVGTGAEAAPIDAKQVRGEVREPDSADAGGAEAESGAVPIDANAMADDAQNNTAIAAPQKEHTRPARELVAARRNRGRALPQ